MLNLRDSRDVPNICKNGLKSGTSRGERLVPATQLEFYYTALKN
jgi:hypothetical protein